MIHQLNCEAFLSTAYAAVDDIIVYANFASKNKEHYYRAFDLDFVSNLQTITAQEGLEVQRELRSVPKLAPMKEDCAHVSRVLCEKFPNLIPSNTINIATQ
jgi:hypothetical protein